MRNTILIFSVLLCSFLHSQNKEVDNRNGFKSIKLGTHYSKFKDITPVDSQISNDIVGIWKTSDKELGYFFDNKIDFYALSFDIETKELTAMQIVVLKELDRYKEASEKFKNIAAKLIQVLGNQYEISNDGLGLSWRGNITGMEYYMKINEATNIISLHFSVISYIKNTKNIEKGF